MVDKERATAESSTSTMNGQRRGRHCEPRSRVGFLHQVDQAHGEPRSPGRLSTDSTKQVRERLLPGFQHDHEPRQRNDDQPATFRSPCDAHITDRPEIMATHPRATPSTTALSPRRFPAGCTSMRRADVTVHGAVRGAGSSTERIDDRPTDEAARASRCVGRPTRARTAAATNPAADTTDSAADRGRPRRSTTPPTPAHVASLPRSIPPQVAKRGSDRFSSEPRPVVTTKNTSRRDSRLRSRGATPRTGSRHEHMVILAIGGATRRRPIRPPRTARSRRHHAARAEDADQQPGDGRRQRFDVWMRIGDVMQRVHHVPGVVEVTSAPLITDSRGSRSPAIPELA